MKKTYDAQEIIEKYTELNYESPLPREGNFELFYETFIDRDNAILLTDGNDFHVFYFTSYDIVEEVRDETPAVIFEPFENAVKCVIIFNPGGNQVAAVIALDMKEEDHCEFLEKIHASHSIQFHFISMLYGELHKMKSLSVAVPEAAFEHISDVLQS